MYSPSFYKMEKNQLVHSLIQENSFALLLSRNSSGVSHLPFMYENSEQNSLVAHMARANPHWKELEQLRQCKVIFQGPHGYISPAWYAPSEDNVPTWNYAVVHVAGDFEIINEPKEAYSKMNQMVSFFESKYKTNWQLPEGERAIDDLMKGIVVFRIKNLNFEAKFKLGQKLEKNDRENVIHQLRNNRGDELERLGHLMQATET